MSDHEHDPASATPTRDLLAGFDAFRASNPSRPPESEPFPEEPEATQAMYSTLIAPVTPAAGEAGAGNEDYTAVPPPPIGPGFGGGPGSGSSASRPPMRRSRTRGAFIVAAAIAVVIGLSAGAYSVVVGTAGGNPGGAAPAPATSGAASTAPRTAVFGDKVVTVRAVVLSLSPGGNGFVAVIQNAGSPVYFTVRYTAQTKFGTAWRPITRAQIVPGAEVMVRGRRTALDVVTATVIAGPVVAAPASKAAHSTSYVGV